ncbi:MAG: alpha/beta hydrolase [Betaproteobacteria bacterium]|nr:alpha/beta hydrolase [Betaproteobacteria bacterium]
MAQHILGPLYYEHMGRAGPAMVFVHPNPMDQSCWMYQMAHLSTWYRCLAIDIPGYGRSPKAEPGLTLADMAQACWEAVDDALPAEPAILVGCSVGSSVVAQMVHLRPSQSAALVLSGAAYHPPGEAPPPFVIRRIKDYGNEGVGYRWRYTFQDLSPAFGATPLAPYLVSSPASAAPPSSSRAARTWFMPWLSISRRRSPGASCACSPAPVMPATWSSHGCSTNS